MIDPFFVAILTASLSLIALTILFFRHGEKKLRKRSAVLSLLCGNGLLIASLLSCGFAVGEIYFRFIYDTTDSFAFTLTTQRWVTRHYQMNNRGMRDNIDYELTPRSGARRVTFIGDSFTQGYGVGSVEDRFVNRIRRQLPQLEVHDLSAAGANSRTQLTSLREAIQLGYTLDTVVLVYCLNDASEITDQWAQQLTKLQADLAPHNYLLKNSYFANTVYFRYKRRHLPAATNYFHFVEEHYSGANWDTQELLFYKLQALIQRNGGQLMVVIFPFLHTFDGAGSYPYEAIHRKLVDFWRGLDVPTLDLLALYREHASDKLVVNPYDAHPNVLAHRLAAETIGAFLSESTADAERH